MQCSKIDHVTYISIVYFGETSNCEKMTSGLHFLHLWYLHHGYRCDDACLCVYIKCMLNFEIHVWWFNFIRWLNPNKNDNAIIEAKTRNTCRKLCDPDLTRFSLRKFAFHLISDEEAFFRRNEIIWNIYAGRKKKRWTKNKSFLYQNNHCYGDISCIPVEN